MRHFRPTSDTSQESPMSANANWHLSVFIRACRNLPKMPNQAGTSQKNVDLSKWSDMPSKLCRPERASNRPPPAALPWLLMALSRHLVIVYPEVSRHVSFDVHQPVWFLETKSSRQNGPRYRQATAQPSSRTAVACGTLLYNTSAGYSSAPGGSDRHRSGGTSSTRSECNNFSIQPESLKPPFQSWAY